MKRLLLILTGCCGFMIILTAIALHQPPGDTSSQGFNRIHAEMSIDDSLMLGHLGIEYDSTLQQYKFVDKPIDDPRPYLQKLKELGITYGSGFQRYGKSISYAECFHLIGLE